MKTQENDSKNTKKTSRGRPQLLFSASLQRQRTLGWESRHSQENARDSWGMNGNPQENLRNHRNASAVMFPLSPVLIYKYQGIACPLWLVAFSLQVALHLVCRLQLVACRFALCNVQAVRGVDLYLRFHLALCRRLYLALYLSSGVCCVAIFR